MQQLSYPKYKDDGELGVCRQRKRRGGGSCVWGCVELEPELGGQGLDLELGGPRTGFGIQPRALLRLPRWAVLEVPVALVTK